MALNWFDFVKNTPLMCAIEENNLDIARILLQSGANVNAHDESRIGNTALQFAVAQGDSATVKLLLDAGADPLLPEWELRLGIRRSNGLARRN